ncbi:MAG: hypothetical protein LQ345_002824 [Seirophora villosa]|nr:MAG: hypothetical protein LQ345_002824 [Seirophora villosa]
MQSTSSSSSSITSTILLAKLNTLLSTHRANPVFPTTYDYPLFPLLHLHSASLIPTPTLTTHLTIPPSFCNAARNLHGGATATILDVVTTLAVRLVADPVRGAWMNPGVSRHLDVSYLGAVKAGEELEVTGEVGKRLVQLRAAMREKRGDRRVVATCEHGKVSVEDRKL